MQCPRCKAEVEEGMNFCVKCGAPLRVAPPTPTVPPQTMPTVPTQPAPTMPTQPIRTVAPVPTIPEVPRPGPGPGLMAMPTPPVTPSTVRCARCGVELSLQAQFCVACGTPVGQPQAPVVERPSVPPRVEYPFRRAAKPGRAWLWAGLAALLVLAGAAYFLLTTSLFARLALRRAWQAFGKANTVRVASESTNLFGDIPNVPMGFEFKVKATFVWQKPNRFWSSQEAAMMGMQIAPQEMGTGEQRWGYFPNLKVCWEEGMPVPPPAELADEFSVPNFWRSPEPPDYGFWRKAGSKSLDGRPCYLLRRDEEHAYTLVYVPRQGKPLLRYEQYAKPEGKLLRTSVCEVDPTLDAAVVIFEPPPQAETVDQATAMKMFFEETLGKFAPGAGEAFERLLQEGPEAFEGFGP